MPESCGSEEDLQLKQAYRRTYESGTLHFGHEKFQAALSSKDLKVQPKKANIAGLRLADVLAYGHTLSKSIANWQTCGWRSWKPSAVLFGL